MQLTGVGVRYGRRSPWVLRGVDLELPAGALVEVTGRNGAGKSSLLRVLAGVMRERAGAVRGRPEVVGWAPERFPSAQPFTARAYLTAQARVRGLSAAGAVEAVGREADRLHLAHLLDVRLDELSKGSAQKVGLAQAVLVPPDLLVLDEPWSGLDADARTAVPLRVAEVLQQGGRVVITDHQNLAGALAPSARWHVAGGTVTAGDPQEAGTVTIEVQAPAALAAEVLRALTDRGLSPRVR